MEIIRASVIEALHQVAPVKKCLMQNGYWPCIYALISQR